MSPQVCCGKRSCPVPLHFIRASCWCCYKQLFSHQLFSLYLASFLPFLQLHLFSANKTSFAFTSFFLEESCNVFQLLVINFTDSVTFVNQEGGFFWGLQEELIICILFVLKSLYWIWDFPRSHQKVRGWRQKLRAAGKRGVGERCRRANHLRAVSEVGRNLW